MKEIDDELNNSAFSATKNILSNSANTKDCLDNLQKKIENLKKEKMILVMLLIQIIILQCVLA